MLNSKLMASQQYMYLFLHRKKKYTIQPHEKEILSLNYNLDNLTPSFPSFSFLMFCAILPISFGGKGPHLKR